MIKNITPTRICFKDYIHSDIQYTDYVPYEEACMWRDELIAKLGPGRAWIESKSPNIIKIIKY